MSNRKVTFPFATTILFICDIIVVILFPSSRLQVFNASCMESDCYLLSLEQGL